MDTLINPILACVFLDGSIDLKDTHYLDIQVGGNAVACMVRKLIIFSEERKEDGNKKSAFDYQ